MTSTITPTKTRTNGALFHAGQFFLCLAVATQLGFVAIKITTASGMALTPALATTAVVMAAATAGYLAMTRKSLR